MPISSLGMFLMLHLGGMMARRRIKPFVVVPGMVYALSSLAMAMTDEPLLFLVLGGLGTLFETVSRSAVTAIIRLNYPATHRGAVVGTIRQWFYITSLSASALAAWALDLAKDFQPAMIRSQMVLAGVISAVSFLVFRTIRVRETETSTPSARRHSPSHGSMPGESCGLMDAFGSISPLRFSIALAICSTLPSFPFCSAARLQLELSCVHVLDQHAANLARHSLHRSTWPLDGSGQYLESLGLDSAGLGI